VHPTQQANARLERRVPRRLAWPDLAAAAVDKATPDRIASAALTVVGPKTVQGPPLDVIPGSSHGDGWSSGLVVAKTRATQRLHK
jgi:hypothetical protein